MRKVLILAACAFLLCCCTDSGEDSVSSRKVDSDAVALNDSIKVYVEDPEVWGVDEYSGRVAVVDSADQLPNCNAKTAGDTVLVNSIKKVYYCDSDNWEYFGKVTTDSWKFPFTKKSSSSAKSSSSVRTSCPKNLAADEICDKRDFQVYRTTRIGALKWLAQNLNYFVEGSVCFDNQDSNCVKYGRFYNWPAAMGFDESYRINSAKKLIKEPYHQGICPAGWHVPDTLEWKYLVDYVGGETNLMGKGWKEDHPDAYGFSAIPTGFYNSYFFNFWEGCAPLECRVDFISATEDSTADYYIDRNIDTFFDSTFIPTQVNFYQVHINDNKGMDLAADSKSHKFSVRCVQDSLYEEMTFREPSSSASLNSSSSAAPPPESNLVEENRCKSTSNYSGFYWSGFDGIDVIFTGIDNGTESSGYWFDIGDSVYGGMSKIEWPEERGNAYSKDSFEPVIYACNGICGTYKLSKGAYTGVPYVGIAFNVVGVDPEYADDIYAYAPAQAADVTEWYGLCLTYSTDADSTFLELSMGDTMDAKAGYRLPRLHLPKSADAKNICAPWGSFRVPAVSKTLFFDNDDESLIFTGPEVAAELATIRFIIRGEDGETGEFNLVDIGGYCW